MTENSSALHPFDYYAVSISDNSAVFRIEPLKKGFGLTLGNALRRVLLSSLRGSAVTAVSIDGAEHEYSALRGCREDVSEIILNLKGLNFKMDGVEHMKIPLSVSGPCVVKAKMLEPQKGVEIINPEHIICHLDKGGNLDMTLDVRMGEGYVHAEDHEGSERKELGTIFIDSLFSPVKRCTYRVEDAMLGGASVFDRLLLTIETDGAIAPDRALIRAACILQEHLSVFAGTESEHGRTEKGEEELPFEKILLTKLENLELSVRSHNCLKNENIVYVGDLVTKTETSMLRTPNFGRKSLNEIKEVLGKMYLKFGMEVKGWPPKNAEELAKAYDEDVTP